MSEIVRGGATKPTGSWVPVETFGAASVGDGQRNIGATVGGVQLRDHAGLDLGRSLGAAGLERARVHAAATHTAAAAHTTTMPAHAATTMPAHAATTASTHAAGAHLAHALHDDRPPDAVTALFDRRFLGEFGKSRLRGEDGKETAKKQAAQYKV